MSVDVWAIKANIEFQARLKLEGELADRERRTPLHEFGELAERNERMERIQRRAASRRRLRLFGERYVRCQVPVIACDRAAHLAARIPCGALVFVGDEDDHLEDCHERKGLDAKAKAALFVTVKRSREDAR